jgi:hypothetical protein
MSPRGGDIWGHYGTFVIAAAGLDVPCSMSHVPSRRGHLGTLWDICHGVAQSPDRAVPPVVSSTSPKTFQNVSNVPHHLLPNLFVSSPMPLRTLTRPVAQNGPVTCGGALWPSLATVQKRSLLFKTLSRPIEGDRRGHPLPPAVKCPKCPMFRVKWDICRILAWDIAHPGAPGGFRRSCPDRRRRSCGTLSRRWQPPFRRAMPSRRPLDASPDANLSPRRKITVFEWVASRSRHFHFACRAKAPRPTGSSGYRRICTTT